MRPVTRSSSEPTAGSFDPRQPLLLTFLRGQHKESVFKLELTGLRRRVFKRQGERVTRSGVRSADSPQGLPERHLAVPRKIRDGRMRTIYA